MIRLHCMYLYVQKSNRGYERKREIEVTVDILSWLSLFRSLSPHLFCISLTYSYPGDHSSVIRVTPISMQLKVISGTNERVSIICTWAKQRVCQALFKPAPNERKTAEERNKEKGPFFEAFKDTLCGTTCKNLIWKVWNPVILSSW